MTETPTILAGVSFFMRPHSHGVDSRDFENAVDVLCERHAGKDSRRGYPRHRKFPSRRSLVLGGSRFWASRNRRFVGQKPGQCLAQDARYQPKAGANALVAMTHFRMFESQVLAQLV